MTNVVVLAQLSDDLAGIRAGAEAPLGRQLDEQATITATKFNARWQRIGITEFVCRSFELMLAAAARRQPSRGSPQHSMTLTARPPSLVSLYLWLMSMPVWRIVSTTASSET